MTNVNEFLTLVLNGTYFISVTSQAQVEIDGRVTIETQELMTTSPRRIDEIINLMQTYIATTPGVFKLTASVTSGNYSREYIMVTHDAVIFC